MSTRRATWPRAATSCPASPRCTRSNRRRRSMGASSAPTWRARMSPTRARSSSTSWRCATSTPPPSARGTTAAPRRRAAASATARPIASCSSPALPGGYAGQILRVDLSKRKAWGEAWTPDQMRDLIGGAGLGAMILYRETRKGKGNVSWDHPDNRLVLGTGPLAGLPVWGTGGLTVCTIGPGTNGPTSTQANGFFGTNLKYCGYDAIIIQGQAKDWVYLYINDDVVELRDARALIGLDTWDTQGALYQETGLAGHQLSVYSIGPAGENLVRFAAIH